jgi:hypothetical protein
MGQMSSPSVSEVWFGLSAPPANSGKGCFLNLVGQGSKTETLMPSKP